MHSSPFVRSLLCCTLLALAAPAAGTSRNNGAAGYADQSLVLSPVGVPVGGIVVPFVSQYHSALTTQGGRLFDTDFANTLNEALLLPLNAGFAALNIHMAQCFSGGFIDELDHGTSTFPGTINKLTINTAARWDKKSIGVEGTDPRNRYSYAWWVEQELGTDNKAMLNAYTTALTNFAYPAGVRALELPQYFSAPNAHDNWVLGTGTDKKVAMLFVGDDRDRTPAGIVRNQRHYRDALRMYDTLRNLFGYAPADIRVYYHNGTAPPGAPAGLPITGAATATNFDNFFTAPPQAIEGGNDEIFVWTSDHGALRVALAGQVQVVPAEPGVHRAQVDFELVPEFLAALTSTTFDPLLFGLPRLQVATLTNPGNDPITVILNGTTLGTILAAGDGFDVSPSLLSLVNSLSFASAGSSVLIGDIALTFTAANEINPIPEPHVWVLMLAGLGLAGYTAHRRRPY
jgi:hypothetical protein